MKDHNLLASVALFGELFNSEAYTDVFEIIAEFIRGAVIHENKTALNSQEIKSLLEKVYGFKIPESVIRTTLNKKLKQSIRRIDGVYQFDPKDQGFENIEKDYQDIALKQEQIVQQLYSYIAEAESRELSETDKREILENFQHSLLGNGVNDKYINHISTFVVKNALLPNFSETLNSIKEGVIIYQGIIFTADLNELGVWNTDLTIYLSAEHLFNALGYNELVFQEIFDDFHKLVVEANMASRNRNEGERIKLRFFEETKREIDDFFQTAVSFKRDGNSRYIARPAMKKILSETTSPSDVKALQVSFYEKLKSKGIILQTFTKSIASIPDYNVHDENVLTALKSQTEGKSKEFNEDLCREYFNIFTKINYFRRGESNVNFERVGHLLMTENGFAKYLASNSLVKFGERDIPFAKDIDYVTTKLWFKLKKGFANTHELPKTFDVVTKAKIILSSKLNNTISAKYEALVKDLKEGRITKDEALERTYVFRQKSYSPEDINQENVDDAFDFLNNDEYFDSLEREKEAQRKLLAEIQQEKEALQAELNLRIQEDEAREKERQQVTDRKQRETYIQSEYDKIVLKERSDLHYILKIFLLNLPVLLFPIILAISKDLKEWFALFGWKQNSIIIVWALTIIVEFFGRTYLFNKTRVKNGWDWLLISISQSKRNKFEASTKKSLENNYVSKSGPVS